MNIHTNFYLRYWNSISVAILMSMLFATFPIQAGISGHVRNAPHESEGRAGILPAKAEPHGYSLEDLAKLTAEFNVTDHSGTDIPLPRLVDESTGSKFQMLFTTSTNTFNVRRNTILYVPVIFNDDSPPVIGNFPDVDNRRALLRYVFSRKQLGLQYSIITIDGQEFPLEEGYWAAAKGLALSDGGGTQYMVSAAFLRPLSRGSHVVEISASATGEALVPWCKIVKFCTDSFSFSIKYFVNVY